MKLETTIKPRRDGTVIARMHDGTAYTFKPDHEGGLCCEVESQAHIAFLVGIGDFFPTNEADFDTAIDLTAPESDAPADEEDDGDGDGDDNQAKDPPPPPEEVPAAAPKTAAAKPSKPQSKKK